ncbi:MAG TPA: CDP-alcohol phosphatidyltransferase family protein [Euzebyales bacterium]
MSAVVINAHARTATDRLVVPIGRSLARLGATPDGLTTFGVVATLAGAAVVVSGHHLVGALVLAVATAADALDGTVARLRDGATPWGAFFDSVSDRVSDVALFGAALWVVRGDAVLFSVGLVALAAAVVTSYIRAKAESLGWEATVGLLERPERVIVLIAGIGLGLLTLALWVLAIGGSITVAQRLRAVRGQAVAR